MTERERERDVMRAAAMMFGGVTALAAVGVTLAGYWIAAVIAGGMLVVIGVGSACASNARRNV